MNDKKKDRSVQDILGSCDKIIARSKRNESLKGKSFESIHDVNAAFDDYLSNIDPSEIEPATEENKDTRRILFANDPRHSAEQFLSDCMMVQGIRSLHCVPQSEEFYEWRDSYYQPLCSRRLQAMVARYLDFAWIEAKDETGEKVLIPYPSTPTREKNVMDCLRSLCCETVVADPQERPTWTCTLEDRPKPEGIIPFKNYLLSVDDFLKKGTFDSLRKNTPQFMSIEQVPYNIDPNDYGRLLPVKWIHFLEQTFDGDESSIEFLQQWFGYCLTSQTWAQKMLLLIGQKRSGKSTIARTLTSMLGQNNIVSPSASSMTGAFPLESWLRKKLAIIPDARFGEKSEKDTVKEMLLQVSGEDHVLVQRKFKPSLSVRLPARIMILSNELPSLRDASGALASRFILLETKNSVYGKENVNLFEEEIEPEIPRIYWWALNGLKSLLKTKRFAQPDSGKESLQDMERHQSPVKAFADECCTLGASNRVPKGTIHNAYKSWCDDEGEIPINNLSAFVRQLKIACPKIHSIRGRVGSSRPQLLEGICLRDRVKEAS